MGSIKKKQQETTDAAHALTEAEFNYVMNINQAKTANAQEYGRVISAFLHYIASSRLGYEATAALQFELDFADKEHMLKITKLPDEAIE